MSSATEKTSKAVDFFANWPQNSNNPYNAIQYTLLLMGERQNKTGLSLNDDYGALLPLMGYGEKTRSLAAAPRIAPCTVFIFSEKMDSSNEEFVYKQDGNKHTHIAMAFLEEIEIISKGVNIGVTDTCKRSGRFDTAAIKAIQTSNTLHYTYKIHTFSTSSHAMSSLFQSKENMQQSLSETISEFLRRFSRNDSVTVGDIRDNAMNLSTKEKMLIECAKIDEAFLSQGASDFSKYKYHPDEYKFYIEDERIWRLRQRYSDKSYISGAQPLSWVGTSTEKLNSLDDVVMVIVEHYYMLYDTTKNLKNQPTQRAQLTAAMLFLEGIHWRMPHKLQASTNRRANILPLSIYITNMLDSLYSKQKFIAYPKMLETNLDKESIKTMKTFVYGI